MAFEYKITVFTPTYNRAYIIEDLYRSLQRQTYTQFEWLVVDDGSVDNTQQLFEAWQQEGNPFPIRYHKQENGGKCRAINKALELARGELFFTVDSDDYLTDDALEKIIAWESNLPSKENYCAVAGNLGITETETPNALLDGEFLDGNAFNRYDKVNGERAIAFYTNVHRNYLYPSFPGEKFMTEAVAWNRMAQDGYKIRYFNDIIVVYEYKPDGLTQSGYEIFRKNPWGTALFFREKAVFFNYDPVTKLRMWYGFATDAKHLLTHDEIAEAIDMPRALVRPLLWLHTVWQFIKRRGKKNG